MPTPPVSNPEHTNSVQEVISVWDLVAEPDVYTALEAIARQYRRGENALSWATGDLTNETLLRMTTQKKLPPRDDRVAFEKAFAVNVRRTLGDKYRAKIAKKRGGRWIRRGMDVLLGLATAAEQDELSAMVEHYVRTRPLHAVVFWMTTEFGLTVEQIAGLLGRQPDTVRRKLLLAQAELREGLEPCDDP